MCSGDSGGAGGTFVTAGEKIKTGRTAMAGKRAGVSKRIRASRIY